MRCIITFKISTITVLLLIPFALLATDVFGPEFLASTTNAPDTTIAVRAMPASLFVRNSGSAKKSWIGKPLNAVRYVAIGGALSAGMRNGGVYRESQLTAFPNLLAGQLNVSFRQPLFEPAFGNGSGYKIAKSMPGQLATYNYITNQLAIESSGWHSLKGFNEPIDNFSFPYLSKNMGGIEFSHEETKRFVNRIKGAQGYGTHRSLYSWLAMQQQCDFFTFEIGQDDLIASVMKGGSGGLSALRFEYIDQSDEVKLISNFAAKKAKGVLATVPDVIDLPFFRQISPDRINALDVKLMLTRSTSAVPVPFDPAVDILLPGPRVTQILNGSLQGVIFLRDEEVLSRDPYDDEWQGVSPVLFNEWKIIRKAKEFGFPVADLYGLYKKVLAGEYVTEDGVKVNPAWPQGNFFSADGLTPSAFGQAIIANEFIKAINTHYKQAVPLLATKIFLD